VERVQRHQGRRALVCEDMNDGPQESPHSRQRGEPGLHRHTRVACHRSGRAALEDDVEQYSGRQARHTRGDRQGRGVSRIRRQQLRHGNGTVRGWRLRPGVDHTEEASCPACVQCESVVPTGLKHARRRSRQNRSLEFYHDGDRAVLIGVFFDTRAIKSSILERNSFRIGDVFVLL